MHKSGPRLKFFYTISRYSNLSRLSYTAEWKGKAGQRPMYNVYIVEDDYMGDFSDSKNLPIHYYDTQIRPSTSNPFPWLFRVYSGLVFYL